MLEVMYMADCRCGQSGHWSRDCPGAGGGGGGGRGSQAGGASQAFFTPRGGDGGNSASQGGRAGYGAGGSGYGADSGGYGVDAKLNRAGGGWQSAASGGYRGSGGEAVGGKRGADAAPETAQQRWQKPKAASVHARAQLKTLLNLKPYAIGLPCNGSSAQWLCCAAALH